MRPTPLPGRPGLGGNRPPWGDGNRPGGGNWGNRPGVSGNWGGGNWANRPWGNNNWGGGNWTNRPWGNNNWGGGNWGIGGGNNINSGNTIINNTNNNVWNNNIYAGGWGGGWGWGGPGWGGGWAAPYYGNWYRGGWGGNGFWAGFGTGALTTFGLGALGSVFSYPAYGIGFPSSYAGFGIYDYFPTWGLGNYATWGLGSVASNWLYSGYTNPYYSAVVASLPVQTTVVYDYSQPINITAAPANPSAAESSEQVFSAARDAFQQGNYQRALELTDQVLKDTPNAPVVHEFRALCLFALKRYDEAAAVVYAVLSTGPGWNWSTLVGLYPEVEVYTVQVRALEAAIQASSSSPSMQFLLGYHYLVQGHKEAAASQFEKVVRLQPSDQLSASFVKALKKISETPTQPSPPQSGVTAASRPAAPPSSTTPGERQTAEAAEGPPEAPPPPASLIGTWKAQPSPDLAITLTLESDGRFTWEVSSGGQKETLSGQAAYKDQTLALLQDEGPPLVGKVTEQAPTSFRFSPPGPERKDAGLAFTRS